ncbi:MAG: metal-dependent hydrolase [Epsilonproteobacteria bacterium]|nr:metal-dependent hydrolase [Campylobacterota bacterium]
MANFNTHFNVASFTSAVVASSMYYHGDITKLDAVLYFSMGILGGVLPDIDSNNSKPTRVMQTIFANLAAFFVLLKYINVYPILNLALIWVGSLLGVMALFYIFSKFTTHRGMFHSIIAGVLFWFIFTLLFYYVFGFGVLKSWYVGMFVFIGYLTHLILDEIYSVDLAGARIKSSFGSAFKLFNDDIVSVVGFYMSVIILYFFLPQKEVFFRHVMHLF